MHFGTTARRLLSASMAVALLGTLGVDGLLVSRHIDHERKLAAARAERKAERHYLQQLQSVAFDIGHATAPVDTVLVALSAFHAGDVLAARDAFAHGHAIEAISAAAQRLRALQPPKAMLAFAKTMEHDVDAMHDAVADLGSHATMSNFEDLSTALNGESSTDFYTALGDFTGTLEGAYARQHVAPPYTTIGPGKLDVPSATDWIFGADRACVTAAIALLPVDKYAKADTPAAFAAYARLWGRALAGAAAGFARLRAPAGAHALPPAVTRRLSVLKQNASIFQRQLVAIQRQDAEGVLTTAAQIGEILPALAQFSKALRSYGAVACGNIIDGWAGVKHKASSTPTSV